MAPHCRDRELLQVLNSLALSGGWLGVREGNTAKPGARTCCSERKGDSLAANRRRRLAQTPQVRVQGGTS